MENLVIYYSQIKQILEKTKFKVGFLSAQDDATSCSVAAFWFRGNNVIRVMYNYDVVFSIDFCNDNKRLDLIDQNYDDAMEKIKEQIQKDPLFPPSMLNTFNKCIFKDYEPNPMKLDKILAAIPKFNPEFLALFKTEIDELTSSVTTVTTVPEVFDFYKSNDSNELYFVGEAFETTVLLCQCDEKSLHYKIIDLRELGNSFTKTEMPECFTTLVNEFVAAMHEIINKDELLQNLVKIGYKDVSSIESVDTNYHVTPGHIKFLSSNNITSDSRGYVVAGDYTMYVYADFCLCGSLHLKKNDIILTSADFTQSIKKYVSPNMFLTFAIAMLSELLRDFNFILVKMPELRTHLYKLWLALKHIEPLNRRVARNWDELDNLIEEFNPVEYIVNTYHVDISFFPKASIEACHSKEDCDRLYESVKHLF